MPIPPLKAIDPKEVGTRYHLGLGTTDANNILSLYGFMLTHDSEFIERTDVGSRDRLVAVGPAITDRDLVTYPRITQRDFSGGGYQTSYLNEDQYFDSDLDIHTPGYLTIQQQWKRTAALNLGSINTTFPCNLSIFWRGQFYFSFNENNGNLYRLNGDGTTTTLSPGVGPIAGLGTDGAYLYVGGQHGNGSSQAARTLNGTTWTNVTNNVNSPPADQWWVITLGTNLTWLIYGTGNLLYRMEVDPGGPSFPIGTSDQIQVPTGQMSPAPQDVVEYQNGFAILTNDNLQGANQFGVWYHDGQNTTEITHFNGYIAAGMCNALGDLYVGALSLLMGGPKLFKISGGGGVEVVADPGTPVLSATLQGCMQPFTVGEHVYWPVGLVNQPISPTTPYIVDYDALSGAVSHLPIFDTTDFARMGTYVTGALTNQANLGGLWGSVSGSGSALAFAMPNAGATQGFLQYQAGISGSITYMTNGWMITSRIEAETPGITKLWRRITVEHQALTAGQSVYIEAHVDQDPNNFNITQGPTPAGASITNSTVGSTRTVLTLPQGTLGRTMFYAIKLTAGASNTTTPNMLYSYVELSAPWIWEFTLDCTSNRRTLENQDDPQGLRGQDLYWLIHNAWENADQMTFYHPNGTLYYCSIENAEWKSKSPVNRARGLGAVPDLEGEWTLTLRQQLPDTATT